jgi:hypothetical protein
VRIHLIPPGVPVSGWPGYFVDDEGEVYSSRKQFPYKELRQIGIRGYKRVCLYDEGVQRICWVHRLVLEAFVGSRPTGMETRHLDGDRANNRLENLVWGTKAENEQDRKNHGHVLKGEKNGASKLTEDSVREIRRLRATGKSSYAVAKIFGVSRTMVQLIVRGDKWGWLK